MKNIFLFPGQGAQCVGMGKDLYEKYRIVQDLFDTCTQMTKKDIKKLLFDAEEKVLQKTDNTQIAMTLVSLSVSSVLQEHGIFPNMVAGFSLGEYAAMVGAGIINTENVFEIVVKRGTIMDEASIQIEQQYSSEGGVGMSAVLGLNPRDIQKYLDEWNISNVYLSMYNSPVQGVLGGTNKAIEEVTQKLKDLGARRIIPLKVSGPFHTPLMKEAKDNFEQAISSIRFSNPSIPIFSNVHGKQVNTGEEMKSLCLDQLINPVRWVEEEDSIWNNTPQNVYESGVGNVLTGLWTAWKKNKLEDNIPDCNIAGTIEAIEKLEE